MGAYYYAGGRRVQLETDEEHVAVDQKAAERAGLDTKLKTATEDLPARSSGLVLAQRSVLGEKAVASLREAGALHPVYRHDRAVIVALPEVRVEFDTPEQRRAVVDFLASRKAPPHTIVENTDERMIVRPSSGEGDDALKIANEIYERAKPAAASVRFIQFVPKPSVRS